MGWESGNGGGKKGPGHGEPMVERGREGISVIRVDIHSCVRSRPLDYATHLRQVTASSLKCHEIYFEAGYEAGRNDGLVFALNQTHIKGTCLCSRILYNHIKLH